MIMVLFEVTLNSGMKNACLKMATSLAAERSKQESFMAVERFESITTENKMLSLQT